jgi:hypothetical protein
LLAETTIHFGNIYKEAVLHGPKLFLAAILYLVSTGASRIFMIRRS